MRLAGLDIRAAIRENLKQLAAGSQYRNRRMLSTIGGGPLVNIDGCDVVNFSSNDYLGFANHPALIEALKNGVDRYGLGSGASPLVSGYTVAHRQLEDDLAVHTGRQRALIFSSGYQANTAAITAIMDSSGLVIGDRLNHASLIDAVSLAGATYKRYLHTQSAALEKKLATAKPEQKKLVITDAVFSMDGDIAPLPQITKCCSNSGALLLVDDAHGFGVLGEQGAGTLEHYQLGCEQVPLLMATFGKAIGVCGAFVAGEEDLIEQIIQNGRPYIYSTALPPALALAISRALGLLRAERWRREYLFSLVERFRKGAQQCGLPVIDSTTPIQPVLIGEDDRVMNISRELFNHGFYVAAIRPPTVPKNTARLRVTITAAHEETQIDQLLDALDNLL